MRGCLTDKATCRLSVYVTSAVCSPGAADLNPDAGPASPLRSPRVESRSSHFAKHLQALSPVTLQAPRIPERGHHLLVVF